MTDEEIIQTIGTYNDYLDRIIPAVQHFYDDLSSCNYQELSPAVPAIIEGLEWIYRATESFVKLEKLASDKQSRFENVIQNLHEALENKDYILLHDLCEFELLPLLGELKIVN